MTYKIRNLGVISDRHSGALIDKHGDICWYCPGQFDNKSIFAALLDEQKGGVWSLNPKKEYSVTRKYIGNSSILETRFYSQDDAFTLTDWMPAGDNYSGICRMFSSSTLPRKNRIIPAPGYGQEKVNILKINEFTLRINNKFYLMASHPVRVENQQIIFEIPSKEGGWAILSDREIKITGYEIVKNSLQKTQQKWDNINSGFAYASRLMRWNVAVHF